MLVLALIGCKKPDPSDETYTLWTPLDDVEQTGSFDAPGLSAPAYIVYTEGGIPHIYGENREDVSRAMGFAVAQDRFFQIDLVRRLSTGTISELLGELGLGIDMESRGISMTYNTDLLLASLDTEQEAVFDAYAEGFNDYIREVEAGTLPAPSEYMLAAGLLGVSDPVELMVPFDRRSVAAIGGTILFRLGYETGEIGQTADYQRLDGLFDGQPLGDLRQDGAWELWNTVAPIMPLSSAPGFGTGGTPPQRRAAPGDLKLPKVESAMVQRGRRKGDRIQARFGRDHVEGWGSNAWAVGGDHTTDGRALLAGDGHLELDIPALMYSVGLDTSVLGDGDLSQVGLVLVGMPVLSVGTNGYVAWSTTQHSGDITDWYVEQLKLDNKGVPSHSYFDGAWEPLQEFEEVYEIADIALLESEGRTERWKRWTTFDGRWIYEIEGEAVDADTKAGNGETVVNVVGDYIIPKDVDGDGVITALSFDFTGLDGGNLMGLFDRIGNARDVTEIHDAMRMAQALSQNLMAADVNGDILYTGYEMAPCRDHLAKKPDGSFADDGSPLFLIDGTKYPGFTIPLNADQTVDESHSKDPQRCVIPHADYPHSFTPEHGYLVTANQDPGGMTLDNDLFNDEWYIGGPWTDGYRADTIHRRLDAAIASDSADLAEMASIQGDHESAVGRHLGPYFLEYLERGADGDLNAEGQAIYDANETRFAEVHDRLVDWAKNGHPASSGVKTFYSDGENPDDAVATMLFNVWLGDTMTLSILDEGFPGDVFRGGGSSGRLRLLLHMFEGSGKNNPRDSAAWNEDTEEYVWWDVISTPEVETSDEIMMQALANSLDFLESDPLSGDEGGFGTDDMDQYLWGLRHQVEFGSLVSSYVDDDGLAVVFDTFAIDTIKLPLAEGIPVTDPRRNLKWFPRPGDNRNVDAANPGTSGRWFRHGSGPVMRMAFALGEGNIEGVNIVPGGQSGILESPYYSDQAEKWLGNETLPVHITVHEVAAAAERKVRLNP